MFKKFAVKYQIGFLLVIIIALIIFILRYYNLSNAEMGLVSALLGGFVSGGLTLIGVKATLDNQKNEKFIDLYPKRKIILDDQIELMNELISFLSKSFGKEYKTVYLDDFKNRLSGKLEKMESFIEKSTLVNGETYEHTKNFIREVRRLNDLVYNINDEFDEFTGEFPIIGQGVFQNKEEYIKGLKLLELYKRNLVSQLEIIDNKYKKLTGM